MSVSARLSNPASLVRATALERPDALAAVAPLGRDGDGRATWTRMSFAELERDSDALARGLERAGVRRGMRTVLMVSPGLDFVSLTIALLKLGAVFVLIDPGIGRKPLGTCLAEVRPEAFIGVSRAHAARIALGWARDSLRVFVTLGRRWFWGGAVLGELKRHAGKAYPIADTTEDETAAILFTSGSTGIPKGVVYSHGMLGAQIELLRSQYGIGSEDVDVATFPPFALLGAVIGTRVVLPDMDPRRPASADPRKLIEAIRTHGATQMFGSPAVLDLLSRHAHRGDAAVPTLKRVLSAGAPVRTEILERTRAWLGAEVAIHTPYGATEALPVASIEAGEILGDTRAEAAAGGGTCVGRPVGDNRVRIIRIVDGPIESWSDALLAPEGEIGEIVVCGAVVTREYFGRPEATRLAKIGVSGSDDFWHRMGDAGRLDAKGRLWFCGRVGHRVTTPNETLFSVPCEAIPNAHPAVFRSALVGLGPQGAQRPALVVELEKSVRRGERSDIRRELLAWCSKHAHTALIRDLLFHASLPVDRRHNAKIDRPKLAQWAAKRLG